jgi:ribonucleoside-diphosphate reductase alpha chain
VEEIEQAYIDAWRIGAKAVSIYRDGSKRTQPLNTSKDKTGGHGANVGGRGAEGTEVAEVVAPRRHKLPDERRSITHKFDISGHEGYITVGLYEDGQPGELFLTMAKEGSTISGFADAFAQAISYALQYGVPLQDLVDKFSHVRFEPSGMTRNPEIRFAKSIVDYIFRWLAAKFLTEEAKFNAGLNVDAPVTTPEQLVLDVAASAGAANGAQTASAPSASASSAPMTSGSSSASSAANRGSKFAAIQNQEDAPPCTTCGSIMVRSGACYKCANCGTTSGCA